MHSLESSLIDIMRAEQDPMKSKASSSFSACVEGVGGGEAIMFAEEARAVQCRAVTGPAAPRAVLIFHTAAYFLPCLALHTSATSCTFTWPSSSWSCCYLTWAATRAEEGGHDGAPHLTAQFRLTSLQVWTITQTRCPVVCLLQHVTESPWLLVTKVNIQKVLRVTCE